MRNFRESPKGEVPRIPIPKLFDNSKLFLVWAPTSDQKRLKRSHFVVLKATGSRSEGLQRFIKQFRKINSRKFAVAISPAYPHPYTNRDGGEPHFSPLSHP